MNWNYRVVEKNISDKVDCSDITYDITTYEIHEIYYDKDGNIIMWSEEAISPYGEGYIKNLEVDIKFMLEACSKPTLKESDLIGISKGKII